MVVYYFPPAGGAGVQRALKFAKHLPEHGWIPHVLAPRNADYPVRDPSLLDEVPAEVVLHRTAIFEPYGLYRRLTGQAGPVDVATLSRDEDRARRFPERLSEWVRSTFFIPDARIGWYPFAVRAGRGVLRSARPAVILSSAPPYTCHLVALRLHRITGLPWVADFRDSWVDWLSAAHRRGLPRRVELRMEGAVLREASAIVTVSRGVADDLLERHPECRDSRWHVLPNGYDPDDVDSVRSDRAGYGPEKLVITHTGTLYGPRDPATLIHALEDLVAEGHPSARALRVRFIGRLADRFRSRIEHSPATACVEVVGYLSHREAIAQAKGSDALLLIVDQVPQSGAILTGKLFEYLGLRRRILALAPPGEAAEMVTTLRAGDVVNPGDVGGMRAAIVGIWERWRMARLSGPASTEVVRFTRRRLTGQLATLLDRLAS
jgi:hypothetical protein